MTKGVGDELGFDREPAVVFRVAVEVAVDGGIRCCTSLLETQGDASQSFGWAEEVIVVCLVADLLASNAVLLVKEAQSSMVNALHYLVIQRCRGAIGDIAGDGEGDVLEGEGMGSTVFVGCCVFELFGRAQEPLEGNDDEVDDVGVECPMFSVLEVEGVEEASEDGEVGWVGSSGRVVFAPEALEESSEYGIVEVGS